MTKHRPTKMHRFQLVIPRDLYERAARLAARHRRSTTQEIIVAIENAIRQEEPTHEPIKPTR